jgi:hypothetical protein
LLIMPAMSADDSRSEMTNPGMLLDRLCSASADLDYQPTVGRHGGRQLLGYSTESDGRSVLEWLIAAPGTRIAPEFEGRCSMIWRVQRHSTHQWEGAALTEIVAAMPTQRDWAIASHRHVLTWLAERIGARESDLLRRLDDELRTVLTPVADESRHARLPSHPRLRSRGSCRVKVTSIRSRLRQAPALARADSASQLRVGQELDDPIVVCLSVAESGREAEIEMDLKRSVITIWPRRGEVAFDGEPLLAIRRLPVSPRSPEWDKSLDDLIERLAVVT